MNKNNVMWWQEEHTNFEEIRPEYLYVFSSTFILNLVLKRNSNSCGINELASAT